MRKRLPPDSIGAIAYGGRVRHRSFRFVAIAFSISISDGAMP
ncbi:MULTISPECIES: hypothetical protein [unclassified Nostoc]